MLHHRISLPLLEAKTQAFMRVVLIVRLVLVVFYSNELAVNGGRIERKGDKRVNGRSFGDYLEGPALSAQNKISNLG